jgi:hypothetical protein
MRFKMNSIVLRSAILAGLWLAACTHTTIPGASQPQEEETRPSPETETTAAVNRPAPAETAKGEPEETENKASSQPSAAFPTPESELEQARDKLRVSQATEARISSDLEQLKQSGQASPEVIRDYETYLEKVQAMVAENRKIVEEMEAARAGYPSAETGVDAMNGTDPPREVDRMRDPAVAAKPAPDEIEVLDRELDTSLAKFDDLLLREMDAIRTRSAETMRDLAEEAADAAKRLRANGVDLNTSGSESSAETGEDSTEAENEKAEESDARQAGREMEPTGSEAGPPTASGDEGSKSGQDGAQRDRPRSYEDDDIVARQLREAAENETDPELKEKLWREYEAYKQNKP